MSTEHKIAPWLGALIFLVGSISTAALGQATRTWVSGVGNDANPCSRTAPCKTFAGAISKTAAGGEINCLDPGGFGGVTITKSISIVCDFTEGGILSAGAGVNGIVVNALSTDRVYLSGLDFNGAGSAQNGLRIVAGGTVHLNNSTIRNYRASNGLGVSFQPSGATVLTITNSRIYNNGNGATGGGILIQPTGAAGNGRLILDRVDILSNDNNGILVNTTGNTSPSGVILTISNSNIGGSVNGISLLVPAGTSFAVANIESSTLFGNPGNALAADGTLAQMRVSNTLITNNGFATRLLNSGQIRSYGNNRTEGNTNAATFTAPTLPST